jgi:hypothetical protein
MYPHVSKCKNDKNTGKREKKKENLEIDIPLT